MTLPYTKKYISSIYRWKINREGAYHDEDLPFWCRGCPGAVAAAGHLLPLEKQFRCGDPAFFADSFRVLCVSYDGFDETEQTEFPTMLEETEKIEAYLKTHCGGRIRAAYGCSLGGSFVGLLAARQNIHMDYGILGSSDLDQASPLTASLQTDFLLPLIYPVVRDGKIKAKFLQKRLDKCAKESGDYVKAFLKMFGDARPYVTMQSCKNQFYSDLITPLPDKIHVPGTEIHIFYALKMGKKYRARYQQHFAHPVLHEQNLQHEELLACHPEQWAHLVKSIVL